LLADFHHPDELLLRDSSGINRSVAPVHDIHNVRQIGAHLLEPSHRLIRWSAACIIHVARQDP
jgi:hypothetical protein